MSGIRILEFFPVNVFVLENNFKPKLTKIDKEKTEYKNFYRVYIAKTLVGYTTTVV